MKKGLHESLVEDSPEWILGANQEAVEEKKPFLLPDEIQKGYQHTTFFKFGCALRAKGAIEAEILAAFIAMNGRLEEPAPIKNLEILAKDICERYEKGSNQENETGASADESGDKETTREDVPDEKEYDFPVEALGPLMADGAKVLAAKIGVPIEIVCSSMLAAAALCVQEFYDIEIFGGIRPLSLFFISVAESGERKSTVDKLVLREHYIWREKKQRIYEEKLKKYKDDLVEFKLKQSKKEFCSKPIPPKAPVIFASEPTVEGLFYCLKYHRNSIGMFADEGGSFLGGFAMRPENAKSTIAKLNQLWDGSAIDRIRRGSSDEGEVDILYNKRMSLHLMTQPKVANDLFNNEYARSMGFLARCLVCHPKSLIGSRPFQLTIDPPAELYGFYDRVRVLLNQEPPLKPQVLKISKEAEKLIEDYYHDVEAKQSEDAEYSGIKDFASKAIEHCIRIAAVIEAFTNGDNAHIGEDAMGRAIAIIPYFLGSQKSVSEKSTTFPSKDCEFVYDRIMRKKEWTFRELLRSMPRKYGKKSVLLLIVKRLSNGGFCKFDEVSHRIHV